MCQARPAEARRFTDKPPQGRLTKYEDVKTLDDHSAFAALRERRDEFSFLWATGEIRPIQDIVNPSRGDVELDLAYCVSALRALDVRVACVDLTLPDVAPFGIHAVRMLATHLQPVHFGHDTTRLGGRRLFEVPQRLGFADRVMTEADLNPCPHPLA
jgi:ribosomal protein S12 methylthiotransferase accessory factor